jgi:maltose/maltodextrin transport system permease protein
MPRRWTTLLQHTLVAALAASLLYLGTLLYLGGEAVIALGVLVVAGVAVVVYTWSRAYTWRYLFPGLVGFALFVIFPLTYTLYISFTNYSSANLLRFEQVVRYFESETRRASDTKYPFQAYRVGGEPATYVFRFDDPASPDTLYQSDAIPLPGDEPASHPLATVAPAAAALTGEPLALRDIIPLRPALQKLSFTLPDGLVITNTGLREFGPRLPVWRHNSADDSFDNLVTGETISPDRAAGHYVLAAAGPSGPAGQRIGPGFRSWVGWDNYLRVVTDKGIQGPFIKIFIWTVVFALCSVAGSLAVGMFLAVLLEWKELPFRRAYRTLLILPYAVPAFISVLIFKGLFNQNFGEINTILNALFGLRPEWFADPTLAKIMILIVNTWLGFPYMMIVCTGILQSVPDTIYEASAIDGSNAVHDFFKLTLPLIFKPLFPLLVASFAFNFNNFLLIYLLTGGAPDMVGASTVAGQTDILVSYTFRIAFRDSAQNFGYASAIATLIFLIVALISWLNLRTRESAKTS